MTDEGRRLAAMGVIWRSSSDLSEQTGVGCVAAIWLNGGELGSGGDSEEWRRFGACTRISCTNSHAHAEYESREPWPGSYRQFA
jgi:hypothetical protein